MKILLVDRNPSSARATALILSSMRNQVTTTEIGEDAIDYGATYDFDLIVINPTLVDMSGTDVIRQLRAKKVTAPIIVTSTAVAIEDRIRALDAGADDYLTIPFHKDELLARVNAVVRRSQGHSLPRLVVGDLAIDSKAQMVFHGENRLKLTVKEYQIFELLAMRKGATITKEMFLNHLYGGMDEPELKIIDVFICKLRRKITNATGAGHDGYIETVWGRGYKMRPVAESQAIGAAA